MISFHLSPSARQDAFAYCTQEATHDEHDSD